MWWNEKACGPIRWCGCCMRCSPKCGHKREAIDAAMTPALGKRKRRLKVGERVRVPGVRGTAIIERRLQGTPGGVTLNALGEP